MNNIFSFFYFKDATFITTNPRNMMLEPILEETSDDENQEIYDSIWSSESDTGSVIRVDLTQGFY